jgi:heptosyltransferase-2
VSEAVVIQTAWLGDVILTTPLLAALAAVHGPVDVVTTPAAAPLIATHPAVGAVLAWDKHAPGLGVAALSTMARHLRTRGYRFAYLPHRSTRSAVLARLAGIPRRVGFSDAPVTARWSYTERRLRTGTHETERLLSLAGTSAASRPTLGLTEADRRVAADALGAGGVTEPFVVLAPGSAQATKRWPYFRALTERLSQHRPVVVIGAAEDAGLGGPCLDLAGRLMIRVTAAVLARAELAITNDSAALHMAQAVGTPVLALFGPTAPSLGFGPRGPRDDVMGLDLPCRPCSTHGGAHCPLGHHRCMRDLTVDSVAARVESSYLHVAPQQRSVACV